jgi:hypothetical protein
MNSKHVSALAFLLLLLGGFAYWIHSGGSNAWKQSDTQAGAKVLPGLVVSNINTVRINAGKEQVTLERKGQAWSVKERDGYAADAQKIVPLLLKLADLKVTQTEAITEALRPRLELAAPGTAGGGIALDLLDAAAQPLGSLIAGKTIDRDSELPGATRGIPTGRYLLARQQPAMALAVSDPLSEIDASPRNWLDKTFVKIERPKSITYASAGKPRWVLTRAEEAGMAWQLKDPAKSEQLDTDKAQEEAGNLGNLALVDVAVDPKPDQLGLTDPDVLTVETFDGLTYALGIGKKDGDNRALTVALTGNSDVPRERTPGKAEKPEDKAKLDKEFKDKLAAFDARIAAERGLGKRVFLVTDASVQPLLKERVALLKPPPKPAEADKGAGKKKVPAKN